MKQFIETPQGVDVASQLGIPYNRTLIKVLKEYIGEGHEKGSRLAKVIRDDERFLGFGGRSGKEIKHYLTTEDLEGTDLVVEEVGATILEGQQYATKVRGIFPEEKTSSNSFRWTKGEAALGPFNEQDEGSEIEDVKEAPGKTTFTILKYGGKARVTGEMIDDGLWNMIEREIRNLGVRAALTIDNKIVEKLMDGAGNEHDAAGSNLDSASLRSTLAKLRGQPTYVATHTIMHPEFMTKLLADTAVTYALNYGAINPASDQKVPRLYGMNLIEFDYGASTTRTWGWAANDEIGILVVSAPSALGLVMNRELRVENFKDPAKDLVGAVGTMRFDTAVLTSGAVARGRY